VSGSCQPARSACGERVIRGLAPAGEVSSRGRGGAHPELECRPGGVRAASGSVLGTVLTRQRGGITLRLTLHIPSNTAQRHRHSALQCVLALRLCLAAPPRTNAKGSDQISPVGAFLTCARRGT